MQTLAPGRFLLNTPRVVSGTLDEVLAAVHETLPSLKETMIATILRLCQVGKAGSL